MRKEKLYLKWKKWATKYSKSKQCCMSMTSIYPLRRELMPKEIFEETKTYKFEGHDFFSVKDYDTYLRMYYDNYFILPPLEKQVAKHNSIEIDFGKY